MTETVAAADGFGFAVTGRDDLRPAAFRPRTRPRQTMMELKISASDFDGQSAMSACEWPRMPARKLGHDQTRRSRRGQGTWRGGCVAGGQWTRQIINREIREAHEKRRRQSKTRWANPEAVERPATILDCGGKRSATPLSHARRSAFVRKACVRPKAPSSLRFAGAVQNTLREIRPPL